MDMPDWLSGLTGETPAENAITGASCWRKQAAPAVLFRIGCRVLRVKPQQPKYQKKPNFSIEAEGHRTGEACQIGCQALRAGPAFEAPEVEAELPRLKRNRQNR